MKLGEFADSARKLIPPGHSQHSLGAIETEYAGHVFRSRLEARWAVFFDKMGITWQYEVQGFHCPWRLGKPKGACELEDWAPASEETFSYLPDFWLPELGLYAEVKGSLTDDTLVRLLNAAAALSTDGGTGCEGVLTYEDEPIDLRNKQGHDVVVLGPIYRELSRVPYRLHFHGSSLLVVPTNLSTWSRDDDCTKGAYYVARDSDKYGATGHPRIEPLGSIKSALLGGARSGTEVGYRYATAVETARSARFEHGQNGAIPRPGRGLGNSGPFPWATTR